MCGFVGFVNYDNVPKDKSIIEKMTKSISHRGPDEFRLLYK